MARYIASCLSKNAGEVTVAKGKSGLIVGGGENLASFYVEDEDGREYRVSVSLMDRDES